jgi:magnesium transporter
MIRSILIKPNGSRKIDLSVAEMRSALSQPDDLMWVSLEHPTDEEAMAVLQDLFQFHPLVIEDSLNTGYQTPKVDDFGSYIFIIAHALRSNGNLTDIETMELNFFLGSNYLVTIFLDEQMPPIDRIWLRLQRDERVTQNGSDFLCYSILDSLVDDYLPVLDQMDDEIEILEDQVLEQPKPESLARILEMKHALMYLRRILSPQRELMNRLARDSFPMIDQQSQFYFRDVYDHLVRFQDLVESLRDLISGTLDIYLNSTSLRLNNVMKALTVVSTIFLPLSFVAGVYGMNFEYMPELHWQYGYLFVWGIFLLIPIGMLLFFKNRGWF